MKKWCEKTVFEKILDIISWIGICVWLVFEFLENRGAENTQTVTCATMLVVCICQAISYWKVKRAFSYVAIGGAVCLATVLILLALL